MSSAAEAGGAKSPPVTSTPGKFKWFPEQIAEVRNLLGPFKCIRCWNLLVHGTEPVRCPMTDTLYSGQELYDHMMQFHGALRPQDMEGIATVEAEAGAPGGEAPAKRPRFSMDHDLEILVEGEVVPVFSQIIMDASPVFARMLTSGLQECEEGRVLIRDKKKAEFELFVKHIDSRAPPITGETAPTLARWADEYQVKGLKRRCEDFFMTLPPGVGALRQALDYSMVRRRDQCMAYIVNEENIGNHAEQLSQFADEPAVMQQLWPAIFKAVRLNPPAEPITEDLTKSALWPIVVRALQVVRPNSMSSWVIRECWSPASFSSLTPPD